jgi:cytochrome P450
MVLLNYMIPLFKYVPLGPNLKLQNARKTIRDTAISMIRSKQAQGSDKEGRGERDILGVMIEENRQSRESGRPMDALSDDEMVDQIMTFLAAGHETTSVAVTWALYLLSKHPEIQERLRKEVQTLDLDNSPSFEQVESLRYLNNVCREVVRFIPPGTSSLLC